MVRATQALASAALIGLGLPLAARAQIEGPNEFPEGPGKVLVQGICSACHPPTYITGSVGYTQDGWRYLFGHMINLSEPIATQLSAYLAENFPPTGERKPKLMPGDEVVKFKEWFVPTLGQRPRLRAFNTASIKQFRVILNESVYLLARYLVRNLSITGKRKLPHQQTWVEIKPELII